MKKIVNNSLFAIRVLIVTLLIVCEAAPAWAGHGGPHYASVSVTAAPTGSGKVYMTTVGDYVPESGDWQGSMSDTWNCDDGIGPSEEDTRTYYVHAQAESGYHFAKWSSNSSGTDSKSTANPYPYSTSASSTSSGSPTQNNIYAIFEQNPQYTCTFLISTNGTYKYQYGNHEEVTVTSEHSVTTDQNFTFTALPDPGYQVYGWYTESGGTKTYFNYSSYVLSSYALPGNIRIGVDFMPVGTPIFQIKGTTQMFTDLNAAVTACGAATKTIVLVNNGTLPAGSYTIPSNVTLLIPFDAAYTCYTETPGTIDSYTSPAAYRTLTMSPGARLIVNGKISLSAKVSGKSYAGPCGAPSESYGAIKMLSEGETKSTITLNNGAKLYSWGYIYGEGAVEVLSGAEVHEGFAFMDFRGAQNTYDMNSDSHKVFPFNQYYIQNIEVPLTIHYGATEKVFSCLYPGGSEVKIPITMVGSSDGLFRLSGEGSKLTKWYDPHDDRQHYALEGNAAIRNISFTVTLIMSITVNSANFVLPITNNMDIEVRSGATVSIAEDICIMPDASVTVEEGATMNIASGKNVYVYDKNAYTNAGTYSTSQSGYPDAGPGRYAAGAYVRCIAYSPSWATIPDREIRRLAIMHTARFKINGTLNATGKIYTTEGGADIYSDTEGATINFVGAVGTSTVTYQVDHQNYDAYYYSIPITSAQLHNADQSYAPTAGSPTGAAWTYKHGHWGWKVVWMWEDGTVLKTAFHYAQPDASWLSSNAPSTSRADEGTCTYSFNGWNTTTNTENQEVTVVADYTKTCTNYYTVTWMSEDGTETLETDEQVGQGENTRYNGAMPFKPFDTESSRLYTFDGWATEPNGEKVYDIDGTPAASAYAIYYAHFAVTEVVAIVKADEDTTYCTSIAEAFEVVRNTNFTPTIQVWKDASIPALVYNIENYCTLDLNGHTLTSVTSSVQSPFRINKSNITFTITDSSESQSGKLSMTTTYGSTIFGLFVQNGNLQLNGGTIEVISGSATTCGVTVNSNCSFTMNGGKMHVVTSNNKEGRGIYSVGTVLINDGTVHVEAAGNAYAMKRDGGTFAVNGGKFNINGSSSYINYGADADANIAIKGGYYSTDYRLATVVPSPYLVYDWASPGEPYHYTVAAKAGYTVTFLNTDETTLQTGTWVEGTTPAYAGETPAKPGDTEGEWMFDHWTPDLAPVTGDATYTATYVPTPPVASVTINGTTTNYIRFDDAWTAANSATAASTLTLLQDVTVTTKLTYNNSNNKNCTLDLNGHTLTSNTSQQSPLHINNTNVSFTVTDGTVGKSGKLSLNSSSSSAIFGAYVESGNLLLNTGTIEVTSSTATACGVTANSNGTFTMTGGTIHVKTTKSKEGRGVYSLGSVSINGGTILVEAGGAGYGIKRDGGTATVVDGKFNISGSTANVTTQTSATANMVIRGGYYTTNSQIYPTAPYYVFDLTSGAEYEEGYRYKVAQAYTLSWSTDGELSGEGYTPAGLTAVGTPIVAPTSTKEGYVFAGWTPAVAAAMPSADTEYTAQWAVASVTIGETTTLYTTFADAWSAVNSASAASTLKLLDDVDLTTGLEYTNASKNCTLDLNGHIISGSATPLLKIAQNGITFTITDLSEAKEGRIECNTHINGQKWAVEVSQSTLRFEGGTIYAKNTQAGTLFIGIYSGASGVIEISGGNIHTVTTANNPTYGVLTFGTATISSGSIQVEAAGTGYAVEAYGDNTNILITGGNFYATGSSAACVHRSKGTLTLRGGYYNSDTNLAANCATNYHVFPASLTEDELTYTCKVAEGYNVTFKNGDVTLQSGLWEKGTTPIYSGESPVKAATAQYTYTFNGWNVPIAPVTADATYTAQFSSTVNTYTVTWKNDDGTTLETDENVPYGNTPVYNGATPTKAKDAEYAYTFNGWSPAVSAVTGDATYTATYTTTPVVASVTANATGYTLYYTDFSTAFADAKGATLAVTITLLRDASSAALQYSGANTDCTLDLNGHTLTSTATQLMVNINKAGSTFTITDKSESKSGQMRIEATNRSEAYGVYINHGHLKLEAGTIYASLVATTCAGVRAVNANSSFTMDGGTIHVVTTSTNNGIGVTASNGTTTINDGTILVEAAKDGYGINRTGGTVTVNNGKFNISASGFAYATNQTSANASVVIRGGYYTTNSRLNPTAPHHVFGLDNQSPYLYEVAEGYTLTWTTDGDALTGTYTSGVMKPGATITAPATPTKMGYTFNTWNPAVAETMPTENTEYTATWTPNTNTAYAVKHYQQNIADDDYTLIDTENLTGSTDAATEAIAKSYTGFTAQSFSQSTIAPDGSTTVSIYYNRDKFTITWNNADGTTLETDANVKYGALPVYDGTTPTKTTDVEYAYTFNGWSPALSAVTADATYMATYTTTPVVASVTANETTTFYTSFADAWTAANSATAASTLTLLQDISGLSSTRTYSASYDLMLDLNGHTLSGSGTITSLFNISCTGYTFTITDGSANHDGKLSFSSESESTSHCVIVNNGTFVLEAGMMEATSSTASIGAVQVNSGTVFTMNENGTVHANYTGNVAGKNSRALHANGGTTTINGGTIHLESTKDGIGVVYGSGNVTFNRGKFKIVVSGTAAVTNKNSAQTNLNIRGGYYSANDNTYFTPHVKTPYHIFENADAEYPQKVAEGYTVTFNNYDDTSLQSGVWEKGTTPTYSGETPTKPADAQYTYTFNGWSPAISSVTASATYTATYSSMVNNYTVTVVKNVDDYGSISSTEITSVPYGSSITVEGNTFTVNGTTVTATPETSDAQYTYTFDGWTNAPGTVTGDVTITAKFTRTTNTYTVLWKNADGTVLETDEDVPYGTTPTYDGATPTKATDEEGIYTFNGWSPAVGAITDNTEYTATYSTTPVIASVTISSSTTYYTTFNAAWTAANSATAASTIKLLSDITATSILTYNNSNTQDCTLDLNGHTISSTKQAVLNPTIAGITFTLTDHSENHNGKLLSIATATDVAYGILVSAGTFVLDAGTIEAHLKANTSYGIRVAANTFFIMNGGMIDVTTTNAQAGSGVYTHYNAGTIGTATINGGTIRVNAAATGYAVENKGTTTITGGKFYATGTGSTACVVNTGTLTLQSGYYNTDANLAAYTTSPYYCVPTTAADKAEVGDVYNYKVVADANSGFHADIVDVDNSAKTLTLNVSMWGSSGWPYTINGVAYGKNSSSGQDKWREDDRTLILPYTGNAGDMFGIKVTAKNGTVVSDRLYTIPTAVTSATFLGDQKVLYVKRGATLTVNASKKVKNIYVAPGAKLVISSGTTLTADTVFLRTEAWESAEMEANGTLTGQICYTRIVKDESRYFQFGLPYDCPVSSVRLSSGHTIAYQGGWLLRSYSESSRAINGANGNNWQTLTDGTIRGCTGYEMFSAFGYYREFYFPVTPTDNTSVSVTRTGDSKAHSGWNIIVSPLMRAYTCKAVPEVPVASWLTEDGSYWQRPIEEIKPAIPFSYQAKENGDFSFGATMAAPAPRRVAATDEPTRIQWIQLEIADAEGNGDQAGIYSHPTRYDETYQTGIDVAKQSFEASRALLYTVHAYGDMAFAGVADSLLERGIPVTVYSPAGQELTFSLRENDWLDRLAEVWLIDNETGTRTDLLRDDYSFLSKAGTTAGRFVIMGRFFAPGVATGIMDAQGGDAQGAKAQKVLVDDKMYILINGRTYDATGKLVTNDNNK